MKATEKEHTLRFFSRSISDYDWCSNSVHSGETTRTHHDLAEFALGDITQLNFLHGYSLPGSPVERAWTRLGSERETAIVGSAATYGKPARTRLFLANHRVATRTFQIRGRERDIPTGG